jgi:hypothetical protein
MDHRVEPGGDECDGVIARSESDDPSSLAYASFAGFESAEARSAEAKAIQFHEKIGLLSRPPDSIPWPSMTKCGLPQRVVQARPTSSTTRRKCGTTCPFCTWYELCPSTLYTYSLTWPCRHRRRRPYASSSSLVPRRRTGKQQMPLQQISSWEAPLFELIDQWLTTCA